MCMYNENLLYGNLMVIKCVCICVLYGFSLYSHCIGSLAKLQDIMNALKGMHEYTFTYIELLL